jgi:hypothetical protein
MKTTLNTFENRRINPMKNKIYKTTIAIALVFTAFVVYGLTTSCPDVAIYVYCPENLR